MIFTSDIPVSIPKIFFLVANSKLYSSDLIYFKVSLTWSILFIGPIQTGPSKNKLILIDN